MEKKYMDLNDNIRAPQELKDRVLRKAAQMERKETGKPGIYSRGFGLMPKIAAAAAVLLLVIPLTAFAAHQLLLKDHLKDIGFQNEEVVDQLINTYPTETQTVTETAETGDTGETVQETVVLPDHYNDYASYHVAEVVCDSESLYLASEMKPMSDEYFLVPMELGLNETLRNLYLDEIDREGLDPSMTIEDYVASLGKTIVMVRTNYSFNGAEVEGGWISQATRDGTVYQYYHGINPVGTQNFTLNCTGKAQTPGMAPEEWQALSVPFDVQVQDKSTRTFVKEFTNFPDEGLGITIEKVVVEETELGTYFTFTYTPKESGWEYIPFNVLDGDGNYLRNLAGGDSMARDNGDGTFSFTSAVQGLTSLENLQYQVMGPDMNKMGPYPFPD